MQYLFKVIAAVNESRSLDGSPVFQLLEAVAVVVPLVNYSCPRIGNDIDNFFLRNSSLLYISLMILVSTIFRNWSKKEIQNVEHCCKLTACSIELKNLYFFYKANKKCGLDIATLK